MTNLPRRLAAVSATLLLTFAASCSSDESSDDTAPTSVATSADSTADSSGGSDTAASEGGDGTDTVADRAEIVNFLLARAASAGAEVDSKCILDIVARLSDADAELLGDSARAGGKENPELSAEGDALGAELADCTIAPATTGG